MSTALPLGLHFGLPMADYLSDKGLGSGDIKTLASDAYEYWWNSWMNPMRPDDDDDTSARKFGKALHKCVLEGRQWFEAHYMRGPNQSGLSSGQKSTSTRAANAEAAKLGKESLKAEEYDRIIVAAKIIATNPDLATAFSNGHSEVSFFWMRDDVRLKMRVDYLKAVTRAKRVIIGIGDLKSIGRDWRTADFEQSCYNAIDDWSYHVQATHYLEGARHIKDAIVGNELVYVHPGTNGVGPDFIDRLSRADAMAWQWVFHSSSGAPKTHSMSISPGSSFLSEGDDIIRRGLSNYRYWMKRKGPDEMWVEPTPVHEAEFERMPRRQNYGR
jgi:hypothetical protein